MTFSDLLVAFVRTGALLGVALVVALLARGNAPLRVAACRWGLAGALGLAIVGLWWASRPAPPVAVPAALPRFSVAPLERRVSLGGSLSPRSPRRSGEAPVETPSVSFDVLPLVWAAGLLVLAGHLLLGFAVLARVRRCCRPVLDDALNRRFSRLAQEAGIGTPRLVEGPRVRGPFVAGVRRATVFLPVGFALRTEPEALEAVLRHEVAHVANGDLRWGLFGRVVRIMLWPQPLVWILRGLQAAAEERACDRQVVLSGVPAAGYAAGLLALREGRDGGRTPRLGIGAASRRSGFGRRIEAILSASGAGGARLSRLGVWAVVGGAALSAGGSAWAFAQPESPLTQATDPLKGWFKGPYAGTIHMVDDAGKPIQGARAWLATNESQHLPPKELKLEGSRIVLHGGKAVEGTSGTLAVKAPGYALFLVKLWPAPMRVDEVRPPKPSNLAGTLLLPDGRPAAGLPVEASLLVSYIGNRRELVFLQTMGVPGLTPTATTDAAGHFRMEGLPPETSVQFDTVDERYARQGFEDRATTGSPASSVTAKPVTLVRAGRITGRLTREGRPVSGVQLGAQGKEHEANTDSGAWGEAVTDADGRYAMGQMQSGVYNVAANLSESLGIEVTARAHEGVRVAEGETVTGMDFELVPGTIVEGTVTLPDGKPLVGTPVGIYGPAHPDTSAWVGMARTDARGRYRARVPAGAQRVYLMDSRYESEQKRVTTKPDAPTRVDFRTRVKKEESNGTR